MSIIEHEIMEADVYRGGIIHDAREAMCQIDPWADEYRTRWLRKTQVPEYGECGQA